MTPGKIRYSLVPVGALRAVVQVLTLGAAKHGDRGYESGDLRDEYLDALFRHLEDYRAGEWLDNESTWPHLAHVGANALILLALEMRVRTKDPRL
jgi:hypothetical protein